MQLTVNSDRDGLTLLGGLRSCSHIFEHAEDVLVQASRRYSSQRHTKAYE